MGKGLKLTSPLIARMGLSRDPAPARRTWHRARQASTSAASRPKIELSVRWLNTELAKAIAPADQPGELELIEANRVWKPGNTGLTQHLLTEGDRAGIDILPVIMSLSRGIRPNRAA